MKNIKPIYFFIITIFTLLIVCGFQKNPIKGEDSINVVYYKMGLYSDGIKKEEKLPENVQKNLDEYSKTMEDIEFGLYFTKEKSIFKLIETLEPAEGTSATLKSIIAGGTIFKNNATKEKIKFLETLGEKFNVILPFDEYKWVITTETKKINGYLCYKATTHIEKFQKFRNKTISVDSYVWFTPEIPYSFGPKGLDGLPGLVLEGSLNSKTYFYATKIVFDYKNNNINIEKTKGGKNVTPEELEDIQIKAMEKN